MTAPAGPATGNGRRARVMRAGFSGVAAVAVLSGVIWAVDGSDGASAPPTTSSTAPTTTTTTTLPTPTLPPVDLSVVRSLVPLGCEASWTAVGVRLPSGMAWALQRALRAKTPAPAVVVAPQLCAVAQPEGPPPPGLWLLLGPFDTPARLGQHRARLNVALLESGRDEFVVLVTPETLGAAPN